ncbi:MAG: DUF2157 domain-containing protein [Hyphomicrobiales bacterium]|nr:DUF2157 domain-containing protein [Hyphomicrobiales bacterium]MCP5372474.1 DUF2157 domain-containing protein [Hyphomicrobiales bacterium]
MADDPATASIPAPGDLDRAQVLALRRAGVLPARRFLDAALAVRDHATWDRWARRALLALGAAHVLAGVVFFFAYNWADLAPWAKFAVVDTGLVATVAGALVLGIDRAAGRAALIGASVLTGVLLAVIGQVYQTGADAYDLFAAWTVLILPFALASRDPAHGVLWLAVAYAAAATYGDQVLVAEGRLTEPELAAGLGWGLAAALAAWEGAVRMVPAWRPVPWARRLLLAAAGGHALAVTAAYLLGKDGSAATLAAGAVLLAALPAAFARLVPDRAAFAMAVGLAGLAVMALGFRLVEDTVWHAGHDGPALLAGLALLVAWCAGTTVALAWTLRHTDRFVAGGTP